MISNRYVIASLYGLLRWLDRVVPIDWEKQIACYSDDTGLPRQYEDHDSSKKFFLKNCSFAKQSHWADLGIFRNGIRRTERNTHFIKKLKWVKRSHALCKNRIYRKESCRWWKFSTAPSMNSLIYRRLYLFFPWRSTGPKIPREYSLVRHSILK